MRLRVLAVFLTLVGATVARADDGTDILLRDLGLAPVGPGVAVEAVRRSDGWVVVTLTPKDGAKLVADPGVSVLPIDAAGAAVAPAAAMVDLAIEYFELPPTVAVQPGPAEALRVEYAYCIVARQCLFGDVTVAVPPPG